MTKREDIDAFVRNQTMALVGLSRSGKKFSNTIFRELKEKGRRVYPINPNATSIDGVPVYQNFNELPERVSAALILTPRSETLRMVEEALNAGVTAIWIQQGAESEDALRLCRERGATVVSGHCILMFLEPAAFFHRFHRGMLRVFGKLPV